MYGRPGKAAQNGEVVGLFYNYPCNFADRGGSEASSPNEGIMDTPPPPVFQLLLLLKGIIKTTYVSFWCSQKYFKHYVFNTSVLIKVWPRQGKVIRNISGNLASGMHRKQHP